jgi:hypothetical protein
VYKKLNTNTKIKYKNFVHTMARSWISDGQNPTTSSSDKLQLPKKKTTPRGPTQNHPGRLSRDFNKHKLDKIVAGGENKKKYSAGQCKVCAAHRVLFQEVPLYEELLHSPDGVISTGFRSSTNKYEL